MFVLPAGNLGSPDNCKTGWGNHPHNPKLPACQKYWFPGLCITISVAEHRSVLRKSNNSPGDAVAYTELNRSARTNKKEDIRKSDWEDTIFTLFYFELIEVMSLDMNKIRD